MKHNIAVITEKTATTCVSDHPLNSKWWCIGAILKIRLPPDNLKYVTCIMTDNTSIKYINPIIAMKIGILSIKAEADTKPPNAREPVSPIKTLAGYTL